MKNFKNTFLLHSSEDGNRRQGWKYIFLSVFLSSSYYFHLSFFSYCWHFLGEVNLAKAYKINMNYLSFHWVFSSHLCLISRINKSKSVFQVLLNLPHWPWCEDKSVVKCLSTQDLMYTGVVVILVWTRSQCSSWHQTFTPESRFFEVSFVWRQLWWHLKSSQAFMASVSSLILLPRASPSYIF